MNLFNAISRKWDIAWKGTPSGAGHVGIAAETAESNPQKDRLYTGNPAARQKFTWVSGEGPRTIFMKVVAIETTTDTDPKPAVKVTYDVPSDAVANANLAMTGGAAIAVQHEFIEYGDGWVRQDFSEPLERLDFITAYGAAVEFRVKGV